MESPSRLTEPSRVSHYSLRIRENRFPQFGMPSTCTLMLKKTDAPRGPMAMAQYASWEQLNRKLSGIGIPDDVLRNAKQNLDSTGSDTITEVVLSDDQLTLLGFADVAA